MHNNYLFISIIIIIIIITLLEYNKIYENYKYSIYTINKITPEIHINKNANITFVYLYTPNIYLYAKHSILNIYSYAKKYNYGFIVYNDVFNKKVSPCWNKIPAILENLSRYKYLIWVDADIIINNFDIKIESFIEDESSINLYICYDINLHKECINSGVMIIKNTEWSKNLFTRVWNSKFPHEHNDQNVIFYEIVKEVNPLSEPSLKFSNYCNKLNHQKVKIFSENAFNTHILNFNRGDFIIHLMGAKENVRIDIMRQINTKLGLDNYNHNECINIINMENDIDKIKLIEKKCLDN